ncbi:hypothetical protein DENSPDRAFT_195509 [Dentipellis sp. KUC8613]|nr:hypothetical protein DENSPDRAFT_195509 [Dentipellis sp. KUC8613]
MFAQSSPSHHTLSTPGPPLKRSRLSHSRAESELLPYDSDDGPPSKIRSHITKREHALRVALAGALAKAEGLAQQIAQGHPDPARFSTLLSSAGDDAAELVGREFAELSKAVSPELEDMERRWIDRVGRTERDMNSECSQRLQKQSASFWKDLEAEEAKRKAALAECQEEHQAALKQLSGQYEKAFEEMRVQFGRACEEAEQRRVRDLAGLQAQFEQEAAVWNEKYRSEMAAAGDRVSAEMAARLQAEEELESSRAETLKLRGELESAQEHILKIQKEAFDEATKREAEEAAWKEKEARWEKEEKERTQARLLREEEMENERKLFQQRLDAKQDHIETLMEQVSGLKVSLQRKKEQYRTLFNDTVRPAFTIQEVPIIIFTIYPRIHPMPESQSCLTISRTLKADRRRQRQSRSLWRRS